MYIQDKQINEEKKEEFNFVDIYNDDPKHKHATARLDSNPYSEPRKEWIEYEDGRYEPVDPMGDLSKKKRGDGRQDWWVVAKKPDWKPKPEKVPKKNDPKSISLPAFGSQKAMPKTMNLGGKIKQPGKPSARGGSILNQGDQVDIRPKTKKAKEPTSWPELRNAKPQHPTAKPPTKGHSGMGQQREFTTEEIRKFVPGYNRKLPNYPPYDGQDKPGGIDPRKFGESELERYMDAPASKWETIRNHIHQIMDPITPEFDPMDQPPFGSGRRG